jgi:ABC-type polysaccharide/polyol phosphate export permease
MSLLRAIAASAWIGWQREVGWTNPLLAVAIKASAPIATVLTASIVYWFGSSQAGIFDPSRLSFVVIGASLYAQIGAYTWVPTSAIAEGKWTNVFPMVFTSPPSSTPYLVGRCLSSFIDSVPIVVLAIALLYVLSIPLFHHALPIVVTPSSVLMLATAMVVDFPAALGLGFMLGGYTIFVSRFEYALPGYIAGTLMIFSEALFPASALPWPLSLVSQTLPFTYYMRASRAAILYQSWGQYVSAMGYAVLTGIVFFSAGLLIYKVAERRAREKGYIDKKMG